VSVRALRAPRLALVVVALAACGDKPSKPRTPAIGNALAAAIVAADKTVEPWRCAALDTPVLRDEDLTTGGRTWKTHGNTLRLDAVGNELVIGVIADAGGASPQTIASLAKLRARLEKEKPDLVLSLGGMGATTAELEATLGTLGDRASWPVVALPGDLEAMSAHVAAIAKLRTRGDVILDGRQVRFITLPGTTIATLPGAGATERLAAGGEGCGWTAQDVAKVYSDLTTRPGVRIVATAEAPRVTVGGEAAGELALAPSQAQPIELVLHGPVQTVPSSARTGGRNGAGVLLSPGTADATRRLPDAHRPAAGVLVVRGTTWAWRPLVDAT
jgi:hypothetical protein